MQKTATLFSAFPPPLFLQKRWRDILSGEIMLIQFFRICIFGFVTLALHTAHCQSIIPAAPTMRIGNLVPGMSLTTKTITSMHDMRYSNIVRQEKDFTCGAAALATILQNVFGRSTTEGEIVEDILKNTDEKIARQQGFSLLDMKKYVERIGLRGRGYQIDKNSLLSTKIPVIALQNTRGYPHFVVVKRVHNDTVYIADPILGHRQVPLDEFIADWNGIVFAVVGAGLVSENVMLESAKSIALNQRADIATRMLPPQKEFGFSLDSF
ncbi:MAG: C39 family peptidase [Burkholderiaceae bacterium]